jgi:hypothetical protein
MQSMCGESTEYDSCVGNVEIQARPQMSVPACMRAGSHACARMQINTRERSKRPTITPAQRAVRAESRKI